MGQTDKLEDKPSLTPVSNLAWRVHRDKEQQHINRVNRLVSDRLRGHRDFPAKP